MDGIYLNFYKAFAHPPVRCPARAEAPYGIGRDKMPGFVKGKEAVQTEETKRKGKQALL